jgi:F0F1-type ATP synthase gamma subunit
MLSWFVGNVDVPAAVVLISIGGGITIIVTAFIAKYRSRADADQIFELDKMKIESEERQQIYRFETDRVHKLKQIEQNLITSHRAEG